LGSLGVFQSIRLKGEQPLSGPGASPGYEGTTKTARSGASPEFTFQGTWRYTGGAGKFAGITGNGTYKGRLTPTGPAYEYEGQYTFKR
jgi:hypothetical protein